MSAEGLFGPGTVTWRVCGETAMILGGGRALILQMAHPLIGAAVEQHSRYRDDRWGRLRHTLRTVGEILFADTETAERSAKRMQRLHTRYRGVVADGRAAGTAYDAADPALVLWVWATLVDSSLLAHQHFVGPLGRAEIDRFYSEQLRFARLCGVPAALAPPTYSAFRIYFERTVQDTLEATSAARDATVLVMNPFRMPRVAAPLVLLMSLPTAGLLPESLRSNLGIEWTPTKDRAFRAATVAFRLLRPGLPRRFRRVRSARAAEARFGR